MILHLDREGNDCIWKLRCHSDIQIFTVQCFHVVNELKMEKVNETHCCIAAALILR